MINSNEAKTLWDLVVPLKTAMLVSHNENTLEARPMQLIQDDFKDAFYFITKVPSEKTKEIERNQEVCLTFSCPEREVYVSISAISKITKNQAIIDALWNPMVSAWFPQGKDDSTVGLIEVYPYQAEYWESNDSKIMQLFKYANALVTETQPDVGKHGKFN